MKNLKKVLALVLAFAMAFTMVISATAFTDDKAISADNQDAVSVMTALGVIKGNPDGSFNPTGDVTRAEMAKMIYVIRSGGSDDASAYANVPTTFTDLGAASWAAGYIKYCQAMGIIAGKSATQFDPNGKVTLAETAKMALVVLGYKADKAGLTGAMWLNKTLSLATENDLMIDTTGAVTAAASRQEAAQVLRNAVDADCVIWSNDKEEFVKDVIYSGSDPISLGYKFMGLQEWVGSYDGDDHVLSLDDGYIQVTGGINGNGDVSASFPFVFDNKYLGEEVSVLFKDAKSSVEEKEPDKKDIIYGVYVTGGTKVYNITSADLQDAEDATKLKFGDKKYDIDDVDTFYVNVNYGAITEDAADAVAMLSDDGDYYGKYATTVKLIAEDGKLVGAYVVEPKLARVTAVSSDKVTVNNGVGTLDKEDNNIYSGVAKDDIVSVTTLYNTDATDDDAYSIIEKITPVSGKLTGFLDEEKVMIDGTTYKTAGKGDGLAGTAVDSDFMTSFDTGDIDDDVEIYKIGSYVYAVKYIDGAKNYAVVEAFAANAGFENKLDPSKVAVMLADGKENTYVIDDDSVAAAGSLSAGDIVKYTLTSDSKIKISDVDEVATVTTGGLTSGKVYVEDTKKFAGTIIDTDGVLFVKKGSDFYVYKLDNLGDISAVAATPMTVATDDGLVVAAYLELASKPSASSDDTVYGIVHDFEGYKTIDGDKYYVYSIDLADGSELMAYFNSQPDDDDFDACDLVSFEKASDNIYSLGDFDVYKGVTATDGSVAVAVDEYRGAGKIVTAFEGITFDGDIYEGHGAVAYAVDSDVEIIYVDRDEGEIGSDVGVDSWSEQLGFYNALLVLDDDDKVKAIFVQSAAKDSEDVSILGDDAAAVATLVVAAQAGDATDVAGEEATYAITTTNVLTGSNVVVTWYTNDTYATEGDAPANLTASATKVAANAATITLTEDDADEVAAGTYYFTVTVAGVVVECEFVTL